MTITHLIMHPMLNIGVRAARAAGRVILRSMNRLDTLRVDQKGRNDLVSEVDFQAEAEIVKVLNKAFPEHAILAEESGLIGSEQAEYRWVVDPLDGTMNFLHGLPHFCVSIALEHQGRLDQAIVYAPVSDELFTASRGEGAWLNSRRLRVTRTTHLENALLGCGFPNRAGQDLALFDASLHHYTERASGIRRLGSAALDLSFLAAGRFDGLWLAGLQRWDLAAGGLIVREAGGLLNDFSGGDHWLANGEVIAATPRIHHDMLQVMKPLVATRQG